MSLSRQFSASLFGGSRVPLKSVSLLLKKAPWLLRCAAPSSRLAAFLLPVCYCCCSRAHWRRRRLFRILPTLAQLASKSRQEEKHRKRQSEKEKKEQHNFGSSTLRQRTIISYANRTVAALSLWQLAQLTFITHYYYYYHYYHHHHHYYLFSFHSTQAYHRHQTKSVHPTSQPIDYNQAPFS